MPRKDTVEFVTAAILGVLVGSAATLLLRPTPSTRTERILKELRPYRIRIRRDRRRARAGLRDSAEASLDIGRALGEAGRELASELRADLGEALASWRDQVSQSLSGRGNGNGRQRDGRPPGKRR